MLISGCALGLWLLGATVTRLCRRWTWTPVTTSELPDVAEDGKIRDARGSSDAASTLPLSSARWVIADDEDQDAVEL